ncbi:MAG: HAD family hydrolase [Candidatus Woesearchaeota archaeon]
MKKVIIFDFDGTIADSLDITYRLNKKNLEGFGFNFINKKEDFLHMLERNWYNDAMDKGLTKADIDKVGKNFIRLMKKHSNEIKLFNKIDKVILKLSRSHHLFVVTSNFSEIVIPFFKNNNIDIFEDVLTADKEKSKVKKIEDIKKRYPKSELWYVCDTTGDIKEAKKAGIKTAGVTWGYHSKEKIMSTKPDIVVDKVEELLKTLKNPQSETGGIH